MDNIFGGGNIVEKIKINDIIRVCNGKLLTECNDFEVEYFSKDTRSIMPGDMYVAIKGEKFDGNEFIEDALRKEACGCIIDINISDEIKNKYKNRAIIKVENSLKAIQELAKYKRELYDIPVVAVTGSVGKTSTKDIIASVLSEKYNVLKTEGNQNNDIGLPFTILKLKDHTAAVIEMGMNHFGEIRLLSNIAKPTIAVITNIGTSHIGNLGSRENILKAKLEILEGMKQNGTIIINNDNDLLHKWAEENKSNYNILKVGIDSESSDFKAYNIKEEETESFYNIDIENKKYYIEIPVGGKHFVYNSLSALAVGKSLDIEIEKISDGISKFCLTSKRMEITKIKDDITVINDSYNASYDSVKAVLEYLSTIKANRKIAILGDMLELGEYTKELHQKVGEEVVKNKIDILITVGEYSKDISKKARELHMNEIYECENKEEATEKIKDIMRSGDAIVLKASNAMKLGEILENLKK